jgi:hypothetical protein
VCISFTEQLLFNEKKILALLSGVVLERTPSTDFLALPLLYQGHGGPITMNIKNASQRVISNEAYVNTKADVSKVSEAGKNLVKDSFENTKTSDSDQGKKKLTFDQERLAATANYNNVGDNASQMIDARSRAQNPPTDKNPYG